MDTPQIARDGTDDDGLKLMLALGRRSVPSTGMYCDLDRYSIEIWILLPPLHFRHFGSSDLSVCLETCEPWLGYVLSDSSAACSAHGSCCTLCSLPSSCFNCVSADHPHWCCEQEGNPAAAILLFVVLALAAVGVSSRHLHARSSCGCVYRVSHLASPLLMSLLTPGTHDLV